MTNGFARQSWKTALDPYYLDKKDIFSSGVGRMLLSWMLSAPVLRSAISLASAEH